MRPGDKPLALKIQKKLALIDKTIPLPGVSNKENLDCFIEQIIDSVRRIKFIRLIKNADVSPINIDTGSTLFDPLKGAVWNIRQGNVNEAYWLIFLSTHFGKNKSTGWNLMRATYGGSGKKPFWTWRKVVNDPDAFLSWIDDNQDYLERSGNFGNHRKYESRNAYKPRGTGSAIISYINWIGPSFDHVEKFGEITHEKNARASFHQAYIEMNQVDSFGRTAKFDYLTMVGKLGLASLEPGYCYFNGATGPLRGARLLLKNNPRATLSTKRAEILVSEIEKELGLDFGMQVLEDSLCNWQKNPGKFEHFAG
jgi:uncharacterized protein YlbG (UPF0298 family)